MFKEGKTASNGLKKCCIDKFTIKTQLNDRVIRAIDSIDSAKNVTGQQYPLNSVDSTLNGHIVTCLEYLLFYNDFQIPILVLSQLE